MQDKKPLTVKVAGGLLALKGALILLTIVIFYIAKDTDPAARTFLNGARMAIVETFKLDLTDPNTTAHLAGLLFFPALFTLAGFVFIVDRKFWPLTIVVSLDLLFEIKGGIPFLLIIILVLILTNPARSYLKRIKKTGDSSILDDNLNDEENA